MTPYRVAFVKRDGTRGERCRRLRCSLFNEVIGWAGAIFRLKTGRDAALTTTGKELLWRFRDFSD
jgi:hypothetical protein